MGTKEESSPFKLVKGYSAQLLPNHVAAGRCGECRKTVYVSASKGNGKTYQGIIYLHLSCEVISKLEGEISQIIPIPVYHSK